MYIYNIYYVQDIYIYTYTPIHVYIYIYNGRIGIPDTLSFSEICRSDNEFFSLYIGKPRPI